MGRKVKRREVDKSHHLSLAELAAHDDACSDALVDNAYYKAQIRKNRPKYTPLRGIKEDEVPQILLHKVIVANDVLAAEKALLELPGLKRYRKSLRLRAVHENFLRHLRKYINMYKTDCAWEVSTTNRYTITTFEAAVTARQRIKQNQVIQYLVGTLVRLTADESEKLDTTNRNFSIVCTGRKMNQSIFLGPARFANHDCDANARLVPKGDDSMEVVAIKNIEVGEEICVSYGNDYFGPNNIDCLCATCEFKGRNGWTASTVIEIPVADSSSQSSTPRSGSSRRRIGNEDEASVSRLRGVSMVARPIVSPSKLQQSWTPPDTSDGDSNTDGASSAVHLGQIDANPPVTLSPPFSPLSDAAETTLQVSRLKRRRKIPEVILPRKRLRSDMSDTDKANVTKVKLQATEVKRPEENRDTAVNDDIDTVVVASVIPRTIITTIDLSVETMPDQQSSVLPSIESETKVLDSSTTIQISQPQRQVRTPRDWYLTQKLIAQPHDRWVECQNERCGNFFLQHNGYQTRRECPRCERHSMLYGFAWPKTEPNRRVIMDRPGSNRDKRDPEKYSQYRRHGKQGKGTWYEGVGDAEERTMDHRTIHRFVLPEHEKAVHRKGLLKMAEEARKRGENIDLQLGRDHVSRKRTESEILERESLTPDGELRRRSGRIVKDRVYANI